MTIVATVLEVTFIEHLTTSLVEVELGRVHRRLRAAGDKPHALVVDCLKMTGYDADARARFVDRMRESRGKLERVAVVTDKTLWKMIVSAMSLASSQRMRAFDDREAAVRWSGEG